MQDLENEIKNIIAEVVEKDPSEITPEARFFEDLGVDSMMALEILVAIEKKYKVKIPEEKLPDLRNLTMVVDIAKEYLTKKEQASA